MERQSSTSDNGSYRNCSKIFDSHGDDFSTTPRNNQSHSEMVPERCLTLALELARHPQDIVLVNPVECSEIGPDLLPRGKFLNASARRSNCFPFRPNGVTIRSQGTKAPVKTLEARDRRSPLTTRRMSRIAKGSYCRARCCHKQALAQIAKGGGLRFRCQPCSQTGELREGWTPILARSYPNEASLCATALT
jgi:hypothetical protein